MPRDRTRRVSPLEVDGRVRAITDGEFVITGPMYTGIRTYLGRTAVLEVQRGYAAQIVVTERAHEPMRPRRFHARGIDPRRKALRDAEVAHPLPRRVQADRRRTSSSAPAQA